MEKAYMESIRGMGNVVGDYVGDGQGDSTQAIVSADLNSVDADGGVVEDRSLDDEAIMQNHFCLCTIVRQQALASMTITLLI